MNKLILYISIAVMGLLASCDVCPAQDIFGPASYFYKQNDTIFVKSGLTLSGTSVFFDDFLTTTHSYRKLQSFYEDSTWASGYKKAMRMIGAAPGFYMLDTSLSRAAGFVFSAGVWSFRNTASSSSLGIEWLRSTGSYVYFPTISSSFPMLIGTTTENADGSSLQVNGTIAPTNNGTNDLGTTNFRFRRLNANTLTLFTNSYNSSLTVPADVVFVKFATAVADITATLQTTVASGQPYFLKNKSGKFVYIVVNNSGLIDGAATYVLPNGASVIMVRDESGNDYTAFDF